MQDKDLPSESEILESQKAAMLKLSREEKWELSRRDRCNAPAPGNDEEKRYLDIFFWGISRPKFFPSPEDYQDWSERAYCIDHIKTWEQDMQEDAKERADTKGALIALLKRLGISQRLFFSYITSRDHSHLASFQSRVFSDSYDANGRIQVLSSTDKQHLLRLLLSEHFKCHTHQVARPLSWKELLHLAFMMRVYSHEEQHKMDPPLPFPTEKGTTQFFWKHFIAMETAVRNNRYLWCFQSPTLIRGFLTKELGSDYFQAATPDQKLFFLRFSRNWDPTSVVYVHYDQGAVRQYKLEMFTSVDEFQKFHTTRFQTSPTPLQRPGETVAKDFLSDLVSKEYQAAIEENFRAFEKQYVFVDDPSKLNAAIARSKTAMAPSGSLAGGSHHMSYASGLIARSQTTMTSEHKSSSPNTSKVGDNNEWELV